MTVLHTYSPIDRETWSDFTVRRMTESQSAHWRFRLFGPLKAPKSHPVDRPEAPRARPAAAERTFA